MLAAATATSTTAAATGAIFGVVEGWAMKVYAFAGSGAVVTHQPLQWKTMEVAFAGSLVESVATEQWADVVSGNRGRCWRS